jgi:hypothetical protein
VAYKKKSEKLAKIDQVEAEETREVVKKLTKDSVSSDLAKLQVTLNNALGEVSAKYQETLSTLEKVKSNILLEEKELERLRQIKATADTLSELEAQIQETRNRWSEEDRNRDLNRAKEQNEYEYTLAQERKRESDAYQDSLAIKQKEWREREASIELSENEFTRLASEVASFPEREKAAKDAGRNEMKKILTDHYETEKKLAISEASTNVRILESEKKALSDRLTEQNLLNAELKKQVETLQNKLTEVSNNAFSAMSSRNTVEALSGALSNQNTNTKGKN